MPQQKWEELSPEEKKMPLYLDQKQTLEFFLERGAISKAQYDKSLGDLKSKMGIDMKQRKDLPTTIVGEVLSSAFRQYSFSFFDLPRGIFTFSF